MRKLRNADFTRGQGFKLAQMGGKTAELATLTVCTQRKRNHSNAVCGRTGKHNAGAGTGLKAGVRHFGH